MGALEACRVSVVEMAEAIKTEGHTTFNGLESDFNSIRFPKNSGECFIKHSPLSGLVYIEPNSLAVFYRSRPLFYETGL